MRLLQPLFLAIIPLLISGCGNMAQYYDGPRRGPANVAIVEADDNVFGQQIKICRDDKYILEIWYCPNAAEILPGPTVLHLALGYAAGKSITRINLPANLKAGQRYQVKSETQYGRVFVWVENKSDGSLVAGERPGTGRKILK